MPFRTLSRLPGAATALTACAAASAVSGALVAAAPLASASVRGDLPAHPVSGDRLVVTVADSGVPGRDGTFVLECHPTGGNHPEAKGACDGLDEVTTWGKDTFAPVSPDADCPMIYGGPATAHVEGTWRGRPVNADYDRSNGCEMERWDRAVPLLPKIGGRTAL
ncbi:SSI family serine proteinase inhibitor [Streptomyces sp. ODS28]|uniref:SSI family serine proteinase inhibitor n=1 Tax=Streptomyces sp. ODS28 TaxID=3136688 RepID=UPI0031F02586